MNIDVLRDIFKGDAIKADGEVYKLSDNIKELRLIEKQEEKSLITLFLIILLALTIIGLIFAIPLLMTHKKIKAIVAIKMKSGLAFVAQADAREWSILSKYQTIDLPAGFDLT
jgi:hypothetical protein